MLPRYLLLTEFHIATGELPVWSGKKSFPHHQQFILFIYYKGANSHHIMGIPERKQTSQLVFLKLESRQNIYKLYHIISLV